MKPYPLTNKTKTSLFCLGCLSALAMAPAYIWPLMVVGYSFLLYTLSKTEGFKRTALYTFLFFFGYFLVGLYWTSSSLFVDFHHWWWALPFSFAGLPILLSLIPTILLGLISLMPKLKPVGIIVALILADMVRSFILTGFPWNMPVHTWTNNDFMMSLLPHIGFYGLNCLTILFLCTPALILLYTTKQKIQLWKLNARISSFYLFVALCVFLVFFEKPQDIHHTIPNNIIMVQANIPQKEKWDPQYIERNLDRYINMSKSAIKSNNSATIIWPETAISQNLLSYPKMRNKFYDFLDGLPEKSHLITGYLYQTPDGFYNSTAILSKDGTILNLYNKHHLVPFGEYMPFGLDTITGVSNFKSGAIPEPIQLKETKLNLLPLICYEIIFSSYAKKATNDSIIINTTNDAWFGTTAGPYQHFDHAIFRARENNIPVFRLSGNGISGIILPSGKVLRATKLNTKAVIATGY